VTANFVGNSTLLISPSLSEVGLHLTELVLFDSFNEVKFPFQINVTNTAPYFTAPSMPFQLIEMKNGLMKNFSFDYADDENNSVSVIVFDNFGSNKKQAPSSLIELTNTLKMIKINASNIFDVGVHQIDIIISDGQPL
jgi:hypothetical protein